MTEFPTLSYISTRDHITEACKRADTCQATPEHKSQIGPAERDEIDTNSSPPPLGSFMSHPIVSVVFKTKSSHSKVENTPLKHINGKRKFRRILSLLSSCSV